MGSEKNPKSIFEHGDYRELLRDLYLQNKNKNKNFSYRFFARIAGFGSASFLKRVIDGESDLSQESIEKIVRGFKLKKEEALFFTHLVSLNQAKSADERELHAKEILRIRAYRKLHPLSEAQYNFYANWFYVPIRELVARTDFKEDFVWMSHALIPQISPQEAKQAIEELTQLGLLDRDENGRLRQSSRFLSTPDELTSSAIAKWHKEMMKHAAESIDVIKREERDISGVTLRVSRDSLKKAKDLIQKFRKDLVDALKEDSFEAVYELNLHFFPITQFSIKGDLKGEENK